MGKSRLPRKKSASTTGNTNSASTVQFKDERDHKLDPEKFQQMANESEVSSPIQKKKNNTGLPDNLKSGIENLSGHSMDDVKVHYNSGKPAQLQAHAYAQGNQIHIGPGQEKHLPHEAWHVVQQKEGRVKATTQLKSSVKINDDPSLEKEADQMGEKASKGFTSPMSIPQLKAYESGQLVIQRMAVPLDDVQSLAEKGTPLTEKNVKSARTISKALESHVNATDDSVARTHQETTPDKAGGLARIGLTEELRIFGHGQTTSMSGDTAVQVGGYTPSSLANKLIAMGLPKNYQGEIYLSGCLTAVGPGHGFLGRFYNLIKAHSPGCSVRGNLGNAVTFPNGKQGVWSGRVTKEAYNQQIKQFDTEVMKYLGQLKTLEADHKAKKITTQVFASGVYRIQGIMEGLKSAKESYNEHIYDTTKAFTVVLPTGAIQATNAVKAILNGAVTSSKDVNFLLTKINDENLEEVNGVIDHELSKHSSDLEDLVRRTDELSKTSTTFGFKKPPK